MKKQLTFTGDVWSIDKKEKALKQIATLDATTLQNIVSLLKSKEAIKLFNENIDTLKTFI